MVCAGSGSVSTGADVERISVWVRVVGRNVAVMGNNF